MGEYIAVIIWGVVIFSWVARFIGKLSSKGKDNGKRKGVEKKIADFFSDNTQAEQETTQAKEQSMNNSRQSLDDEWVPAYEESPKNDDRPLQKATNKDNSRNTLERPTSRDELSKKRQNIDHDEVTNRGRNSFVRRTKRNSSPVKNKKDIDNAYRQDNKRGKSYLNENSFSSDDLIKGVIFKEILDQPRAKRPYKPFDGKR